MISFSRYGEEMMDSNLIFNLTLPEVSTDIQSEELPIVLPLEEEQKPVVLLLGWAGAEDRYLKVYSSIYEAQGLLTLRCIAPVKAMMLNKHEMTFVADRIVKLFTDLRLQKRPIIVHCFSNGGAFTYQHFSQALKSSIEPLKIKGVIFDSAPSKRRISTFWRAIRPIIGGNIIINLIFSLFLLQFFIATWIWEYIQSTVLKRDVVQFKPLDNLLNEENTWPQHFIYSTADKVIPYRDVEYFAEHRKSLGVEVTMLCFDNTPHVKHYPGHKLSYTQSVIGFLNKNLNLTMA